MKDADILNGDVPPVLVGEIVFGIGAGDAPAVAQLIVEDDDEAVVRQKAREMIVTRAVFTQSVDDLYDAGGIALGKILAAVQRRFAVGG